MSWSVSDELGLRGTGKVMYMSMTIEGEEEKDTMMMLNGGNMPVFLPGLNLSSDAGTPTRILVPAMVVDICKNNSGIANAYKDWAQWAADQGKKVVVQTKKTFEIPGVNRVEAEWVMNVLCYDVLMPFNEEYKIPRLSRAVCGTSTTQSMELGTLKLKMVVSDSGDTVEKEFSIRTFSQNRDAYASEEVTFLRLSTKPEKEEIRYKAQGIGWEYNPGEKRMYANLGTLGESIQPELQEMIKLATIYTVAEANTPWIWEEERPFPLIAEPRDGVRVGARFQEAKGTMVEKLLEAKHWPVSVKINIDNLETSRRREVRFSIMNEAGWSTWSRWGGQIEFMMRAGTTKEQALKVAKAFIDVATGGRTDARKVEDLDKKPRKEAEMEEKADLERLEKLIGELEKDEGFKKYLLFKVKQMNTAISKIEKEVLK